MRRRPFVRTVARAAFGPILPRLWGPGQAVAMPTPERRAATTRAASGLEGPVISVRDPRIMALAHQAVDAARAAGAQYADVRITQTVTRAIGSNSGPSQSVQLGLGVRAFVQGAWGWAATPTVSTDEAVRVARVATTFATRAASRLATRRALRTVSEAPAELGTLPAMTRDWTTPVRVDPFELNLEDLQDWLFGVTHQIGDLQYARKVPSIVWQTKPNGDFPSMSVTFDKQDALLVSTEGTVLTRTVILTTPDLNFRPLPTPMFNLPVQAGWEYLADLPLLRVIEQAMDQVDATPPPPPQKPLEVGRYDIVFSAAAMAQLLTSSLGAATHLDRALGYEAYAGSSSYLGPDPFAHLGTAVASPVVTITAERSNPLGIATVPWDDEGVVPRDVPLVAKGILQNYQTTREQAAWLAPWYAKQGQPVQSLGCAQAWNALTAPMQHTPNLVLHSGPGTDTEASLVRDLEHGLHITTVGTPGLLTPSGNKRAPFDIDWQCLDAFIYPFTATEIRHGKPVATKQYAQPLAVFFNSDTFWKHVQVLGGAASAEYRGGFWSQKGDPIHIGNHSVGAVPARVNQIAVLNPGDIE